MTHNKWFNEKDGEQAFPSEPPRALSGLRRDAELRVADLPA
jgi:hypothetical protein